MAVRSQGAIVAALVAWAMCGAALVALQRSTATGTPPESREGRQGFVTDSRIQPILNATQAGDYALARRLATTLIERPRNSFATSKEERFLKGTAYALRGEAAARLSDDAASLADYRQATILGHPGAPYQVGARLTVAAAQEVDPSRRTVLRQEVEAYFLIGAELGDPTCMQMLQTLYESQSRGSEGGYWSLLRHIGEDPPRTLEQIYNRGLDDNVRTQLSSALRQYSLTGGDAPTQGRLPGRSTLTAAYVDYGMRRQLAFIWRAFFSSGAPDATLMESFEQLRSLTTDNPFAETYLLLAGTTRPGADVILTVPNRTALSGTMLPGDWLVVRCGVLVHQALVWSVNRTTGGLTVLDPFYEFWQPSHNRCIHTFGLTPYRQARDDRELVQLALPEVIPLLEGVIAIRDRR
jgi:hypothetical protein